MATTNKIAAVILLKILELQETTPNKNMQIADLQRINSIAIVILAIKEMAMVKVVFAVISFKWPLS